MPGVEQEPGARDEGLEMGAGEGWSWWGLELVKEVSAEFGFPVGILSSQGRRDTETLRARWNSGPETGGACNVPHSRRGRTVGCEASGNHSVLPFWGSPLELRVVLVSRPPVEPGPLTCELGFTLRHEFRSPILQRGETEALTSRCCPEPPRRLTIPAQREWRV